MATLSAGSVATLYLPGAQTITFTPGTSGRISINGRNVDGSAVTPQEIYKATSVAFRAGATVTVEAINVDCTYTDVEDSSLSAAAAAWAESSVSEAGRQFQLKKWRAALAKAVNGQARARVLFAGDSTTRGTGASGAAYAGNKVLAYPDQLARLAEKRVTTINLGNSFGDSNTTVANHALYDPRWSFGAGWTSQLLGGGIGGGTIAHNAANTNAANFTPVAAFDSIKIWYLTNPGFQPFTVAVDGGASLGTITNTGANSMSSQTITCALGTHTINLAKTAANAAAVHIVGVETWNSTALTVEYINGGASSATSAVWASGTYYQAFSQLAAIAPDLVVLSLGINDWATGVSESVYAANMQTIITQAKTVADVILVSPTPSQIGFGGFSEQTRQQAIVAQMQTLAITNDVPFVDMWSRMVSYTEASGRGLYYDGAHPKAAGYFDWAAPLHSVMYP